MRGPDLGRIGRRVGGVAIAAVLLGVAVWSLQRPPRGPVEIVWDKEVCAHCRMHVGEPRFAAQLQTRDGRVFNFDDPGCALRDLAGRGDGEIHALWFHAVDQDRWLAREEVAFAPARNTPMGFGLGAVPRGAPGAISLEEALRRAAGPGGGR